MLVSIRARLGIVFASFLLLVAGSAIATFATVQAQAADALVINLAGRQRMLTQKMSKAVLGIAQDPASDDYRAELHEAAYLFDQTLTALLDGGSVPYGGETVSLPPTTELSIHAQLEGVVGLWNQFRKDVETVQAAEPGDLAFTQAAHDIESFSLVILQETDRAVQLYEAVAKTKLARLRTIQALFTISAVGLLFAGYVVTQRTIVSPLSELEKATQRIADGDLESPVEAASAASSEVRALAGSFESMRHELAGSRLESERWAAELEERVDQRTRQLAALFDVGAELSSELEIQSVLESVVEKTRSLAGGEVAVLCLLDPVGESLAVVATSGSADALIAQPQEVMEQLRVSAHTIGAAIQHEGCDCPLLQPQFRRSHLAVPLRIGDRILGALCVGHRDKARFGEQEARLLTLLANAGAVALENARAYEQTEQAATLAERGRILAEIHDGLAQTLSFLDLRLDLVQGLIEDQDLAEIPEHLALTRRTVGQAGREVRRLMSGLQASTDSPRTLEELLRQTVERFAEEWEMDTELLVETKAPIRGSPEVHEQVVRVVTEALANVHKHANASRSSVTVRRQGAQAIICVQDDGPGFDVNAPADGQHHFGLKVMKTRAKWIGGELDVESALRQGTTITLRWSTTEG